MVGKDGARAQKSTVVKEKSQIKCYNCKQYGHYRNQCENTRESSKTMHENKKNSTNTFGAVFLHGDFNTNDWYIDSRANSYMTTNQHWVTDASYIGFTKEIVVANQSKVLCTKNVQITTTTDESIFEVMVENVLCVLSLSTNLLSVSQLIKQGNKVFFTSNGCKIFNKKNTLVATASITNGVYKLNTHTHLLAAAVESPEVWHRRLGHVNSHYMNNMQNAVEGIVMDKKADISKMNCVVCCKGKQSRLPFAQEGNRSTELLNTVHSDICGPMRENISLGGSRSFLFFVDDYSRMAYVYFLKNKNQALQCFKEYKTEVENLTSKKIKILRSDNGREFCNNEFNNYLKKMGIVH